MGIATTKSFADIKEGTQVEVVVADATYDEEGRFGPAVELALEVLQPSAHAGDSILSTFGLSQPRLSKVRDLRADGLDDAAIASVLENKNFEFESIDDPETPKLGGALLRIVKACYNADTRAVKKLLEECDTFDDLADALIGRRFVATTRKDKNDYTRIDGKGEFYRVMADEPKNDLRQKQEAVATAKEAHHGRVDDGHVEEEEDADFSDIPSK
jgi:hypothetical protein